MEKIGLIFCGILVVSSVIVGLVGFCAYLFGQEDEAIPVLVGWLAGTLGMWALWMLGVL